MYVANTLRTHTLCKHTAAKSEAPEERRSSVTEDETKISKPKKEKSDKKPPSKKKEIKSLKASALPPVESTQPPPGPMVALGRPKEKLAKRPRDTLLAKSGQPPPEKKVKGNQGE